MTLKRTIPAVLPLELMAELEVACDSVAEITEALRRLDLYTGGGASSETRVLSAVLAHPPVRTAIGNALLRAKELVGQMEADRLNAYAAQLEAEASMYREAAAPLAAVDGAE
jgi:hypothetical protein